MKLTASQIDSLTELFNIGIGKAASSMSNMLSDEISLSVPNLEVCERNKAIKLLSNHGEISGVIERFGSEAGGGAAMLLFHDEASTNVVRAMLGENAMLELTELEQEALTEVGNIILNACLATMANVMHIEFSLDLPTFVKGRTQDVLESRLNNDTVILCHIHFSLAKIQVEAFLAFLIDMKSFNSFSAKVEQAFKKLTVK